MYVLAATSNVDKPIEMKKVQTYTVHFRSTWGIWYYDNTPQNLHNCVSQRLNALLNQEQEQLGGFTRPVEDWNSRFYEPKIMH